MTDQNYVDSLIQRIEIRDQLIGTLKEHIKFLEREIERYRKLETVVYQVVSPEERRVVLAGVQPS